jgi:hypothetical protein
MITAKQATELREKAIENEIAEKRERASRFCEELGYTIERRAKEKYTSVKTEVDNDIRNYVSRELADNGYRVEINTDNTITVMWS